MGNDLDNSKVEEEVRWKPTCNRFVAFFDVMGFKDYVMRNKHEDVLKRITDIKNAKQLIIDGTTPGLFMDTKLKSFQFSDSFFIFSESAGLCGRSEKSATDNSEARTSPKRGGSGPASRRGALTGQHENSRPISATGPPVCNHRPRA